MPTSRRSSRISDKQTPAQPAPAASAPAITAPNGESTQPLKKARFTRAEKRAFAREQASNPFLPSRPRQQQRSNTIGAPKSLHANYGAPNTNIDNAIGFLLAQRGAGKKQQGRAIKSVFQGFRLEQPAIQPRAAPVKKELSAAKLEKIQKRREIRAEKRQAYLAEKAKSADAQVAVTTATATVVEQRPLPADDEIDFDDL